MLRAGSLTVVQGRERERQSSAGWGGTIQVWDSGPHTEAELYVFQQPTEASSVSQYTEVIKYFIHCQNDPRARGDRKEWLPP